MDNQPENNWDALIEELGAEPAAESPRPTDSQPQNTSAAEAQPSLDLDSLAPPEPAASGWDSLLGDLGLEESAEAPVPQTPRAEPTPAQAAAPASPEPPATESPDPQAAPPEPDAHDGSFDAAAPAEDDKGRADEITAARDAAPADEKAESGSGAVVDPASAPSGGGGASGVGGLLPDIKASLSLPDWFPFAGRRRTEPAADATDPSVIPPPDQAADASPPSSPEAAEAEAATGELPDTATDTAGADTATTDAPAPTDGESQDDEKPARGRRRRRRGGRRRRRGANGSADEATETPVNGEASAERGGAPGRADSDEELDEPLEGEAPLEEADPLDDPAAVDQSEDDPPAEGGRSSRERAASAKAIPSWPDAIGVVVDGNIAKRSERRPAVAASGGRGEGGRGGSGRGRSRGRRRRKSSE